ncbi:toll/interleukin-1 receptor domain-containing protein [Flavobacterium sp. 83]|uniref:toll/interleukin-1 receptor domain-containing protein n=1 Tax=Flavobacterium sp. 83 TaxID=1131812 RepID=UPI00068DC8E1|nr:toll/interleukin-1 receptor domain-containing protein [Flavobacterium sp. 83]
MTENRRKVFISYSWDNSEHQEWVLSLAKDLMNKFGIQVILDQFELSAGKDLTYFMESSIENADKVLIILTPNYKIKAEDRKSGVGYETSMITQEIFESSITKIKFIPILRVGDSKSSSPKFLKSKFTIL